MSKQFDITEMDIKKIKIKDKIDFNKEKLELELQ